MTPKEKAIELADIYFEIVKDIDWRKTNSPPMFMAHVKKCALTAVDECIESTKQLVHNYTKGDDKRYSDIYLSMSLSVAYWQEVKQEIEKL